MCQKKSSSEKSFIQCRRWPQQQGGRWGNRSSMKKPIILQPKKVQAAFCPMARGRRCVLQLSVGQRRSHTRRGGTGIIGRWSEEGPSETRTPPSWPWVADAPAAKTSRCNTVVDCVDVEDKDKAGFRSNICFGGRSQVCSWTTSLCCPPRVFVERASLSNSWWRSAGTLMSSSMGMEARNMLGTCHALAASGLDFVPTALAFTLSSNSE